LLSYLFKLFIFTVFRLNYSKNTKRGTTVFIGRCAKTHFFFECTQTDINAAIFAF
jgi:hypothetical protein